MKKRSYHFIKGKTATGYNTQEVHIESEDTFPEELILLALPISMLDEMDQILPTYHLKADTAYFYEQCREVISAPEKHVNEKGEGSLTFQSYFHNFPDSLKHVNNRAIVVVAIHPKTTDTSGLRDYWVVHYGHANVFDFMNAEGQKEEGFYYNVLRVSERTEDGQKIYRRRKIFTLIFSIFHSLVEVYGVHYAYAAMGKQNEGIVTALKQNSEKYNKQFEIFPMRANTQVNRLFGSSSADKKLEVITQNMDALRAMYDVYIAQKKNYIFQALYSFEAFLEVIQNVKKYSKSSEVYRVEKEGKVAYGLAVNYGDYFQMTLQNPKGFFKFVASLKLTDNLLYPMLLCGDTEAMKPLLKGMAYRYQKLHKCHISILNSYAGDPFAAQKKAVIFDDMQFFVITDVPALHQKNKANSALGDVNERYFIDNVIL